MARLFISHSSANNAAAIALAKWLAEQGFQDLFLDIDPNRGLAPGERWQQALKAAADRCEAVLFLVSTAWLASRWCLAEFLLAKTLHKRIFGLIIEPVPLDHLPPEMTAEWQLCELVGEDRFRNFDVLVGGQQEQVSFREAGLDLLRRGLERAGLDARNFAWPPPNETARAPYRGLGALEPQDAAVFFGRDAAIIRGLDRIRGLAEGGVEKLFVILGASGSGKSSFLRAGLWPRLRRDDFNFLTLPIIRPETAVISGKSGLAASLSATFDWLGEPRSPGRIKEALNSDVGSLGRLCDELVAHARRRLILTGDKTVDPVIVISLDQAEELFSGDGATEAENFIKLFVSALASLTLGPSRRTLGIVTIRSDRYELLQTNPLLTSVKQDLFNLPPISQAELKSVIEGPAQRIREAGGRLVIEPALTERLIAESQGADVMPLLGFTLERLYSDYGSEGRLNLDEYRAIGGVKGSIEAAITQALAEPDRPPRIPAAKEAQLALLRSAFIPWLARVDYETGAAIRRVARMSEIPSNARQIVERLVEARLLVADRRSGIDVVEVAHESLLRQWPALTAWLTEDAGLLNIMDSVKMSAADWTANAKESAWLMHIRERLRAAERVCERTDLAANLNEIDQNYLAACRMSERKSRKRTRVIQSVFGMLLTALIALGWSGYGGFLDPNYLEGRINLLRNITREASLMPGNVVSECTFVCPQMVVVPAGKFMMGSNAVQIESPPHEVSIANPFLVSQFEITFDQWDACVERGGCNYRSSDEGWGRGNRPVINVSWDDIQPYLAWLTKITGKPYRLLTEAEWEYASRAGTTSKFYWGEEVRPDGRIMANCANCGSQWDLRQTAPSGSFPPNAFGLYDMAGNVAELVADTAHDHYRGAPSDGSAWLAGGVPDQRVLRGGAWFVLSDDVRTTNRGWINNHDRGHGIGFRVARTIRANALFGRSDKEMQHNSAPTERVSFRTGHAIVIDGYTFLQKQWI